jgi:hypothetical protein
MYKFTYILSKYSRVLSGDSHLRTMVVCFIRGLNIFGRNSIGKPELHAVLKSIESLADVQVLDIVCHPNNSGNVVVSKNPNLPNTEIERLMIRALQSKLLQIKAVAVEDAEKAFDALKKSLQFAKESGLGLDENTLTAQIAGYEWKLGIVFQSPASSLRLSDYLPPQTENPIVKVLGGEETHLFILKKEEKKHESRISWGHASGAIESILPSGKVVPLTARSWDVVHATVGASIIE